MYLEILISKKVKRWQDTQFWRRKEYKKKITQNKCL